MASKRQVGKSVQARIMESNSARHWRLRPGPDPIYLRQLAVRLADAARLPLRVAKARVQQLSVSATSKPPPGRPPSDER